MEIKTTELENYTEIKLIGRLDTNTSPDFEKSMTEILNSGKEDILVNFEELVYISSSGLRVFLVAAKILDGKGKKLNFCCMKDFIKEVFDIAGFSVLFNIYNKREDILG